jgi:uncharacterized protein GlcG (DUF336 family)
MFTTRRIFGVSGNMPDNDELCAQAALDAIKDLLK